MPFLKRFTFHFHSMCLSYQRFNCGQFFCRYPFLTLTLQQSHCIKPILFYKLCLFQSPESVKLICKQGQFKASVLFSSPLNEPYDLAVLSVGKIPGLKQLTFANKPAVVGNPIQKINNLGYFLCLLNILKQKLVVVIVKLASSVISTSFWRTVNSIKVCTARPHRTSIHGLDRLGGCSK